jgi:transcriptional antiterminator NusG
MTARWYVVNVYSGSEKKVADSIKEQAIQKKLDDKILDVLVPMETIVDAKKSLKKGEKVNTERKFFPGYILVKMVLTDESQLMVQTTPRVSGFLGGRNKPQPISEAEVERIMQQITEGLENPQVEVTFETGEQIRVIDGPFASFVGVVEDVDAEKSRLKVSVSIFGRYTPVELEFSQVEKV